MKDQLNPAPSEVMERCNFNQAKQEKTESIAEFAARLKKLALTCNFEAQLMTALRDQFVCGLSDHETRVELFQKSKLTFDVAFTEAVAREKALQNAEVSHKVLDKSISQQRSVYALNSTKLGRGNQFQEQQASQRNHSSVNNNNSKQKSSTSESKGSYVCYCCGKQNHMARRCRYRFDSCTLCKKKGHLEQACRLKDQAQQQVKFLETPTSSTEPQGQEHEQKCVSEMYDKYEFFSLKVNYADHKNKICTRGDDELCNAENVKADPMFINVAINGKEISMEIDTGVYATVLSEKVKNEFFKELKLVKTKHFLEDYVENVLNPVGSFENLSVMINNKTRKLGCFVLPGRGPPLIGRQWLAAFGLWPLKVNIAHHGNGIKIQNLNVVSTRKQLVDEFNLLFSETPGLYNKRKLTIYLRDNAKPIALNARHVAYAMKPLMEKEIARLVQLGHLVPVER